MKTAKLLARPALLARVREAVADCHSAHLTCFNATPLERTLANINMDGLNQWGPTRDLTVIGLSGDNTLVRFSATNPGDARRLGVLEHDHRQADLAIEPPAFDVHGDPGIVELDPRSRALPHLSMASLRTSTAWCRRASLARPR